MSTPEKKLISRHSQSNSTPTFLTFRTPAVGLRLTAEEWKLIVGALSAYQHNHTYRSLYEKFSAQTS